MNGNINRSQAQQSLHYFLFDPNIYTSVILTLKRKSDDLSVEKIKNAVEKAYTQNETTMSKVVLDNGNAYFENISETGCKVFVDQRNWVDILNENQKNTFKINEGEFIRTFIIEDKEEISVFIMAHHIVGDGYSQILFAQDILSNLAGEAVEYKPLNNQNDEVIPNIKYPFMKKLGIKLLNAQWKKMGKVFTWEDYYDIHRKFWENRKTQVSATTISEDELLIMKEESKKMGITLNSYIVAKQVEKNPEYEIIGIPTSYRGNNRSLANKIAAMKVRYRYNKEASFKENAKEIHAIIKDSIEDPSKRFFVVKSVELFNPTLVDGALMAKYAGYKNETAEKMIDAMAMSGANKTQLGVTNLANIKLKAEYDSFQVQDVKCLAASMATTRDVLAVCTFENRMNLCFSTVEKVN